MDNLNELPNRLLNDNSCHPVTLAFLKEREYTHISQIDNEELTQLYWLLKAQEKGTGRGKDARQNH